ncbi:MAG: hypothetical protein ACXVAR_07115 [Vulcanimicrobiaceae bacterium]
MNDNQRDPGAARENDLIARRKLVVTEGDHLREKPQSDVLDDPVLTTGGTGLLPEGGAPNPGFLARGD